MGKMKLVTGGPELRKDCKNYDKDAFSKAGNTVDTIISRLNEGKVEVLLIKRKYEPDIGKWAIPGGFLNVEKNEPLDAASVRKLEEETNVSGIHVRQLHTYGEPDRDLRDRIITTAYYALISNAALDKTDIVPGEDVVPDAYKWADVRSLRNMALDHKTIIQDFLKEIQERVQFSPIAFELVPEEFTWKEIKESFEAILGKSMDGNFRRNLKSLYEIEDTGRKTSTGYRPAALLKFKGSKRMF